MGLATLRKEAERGDAEAQAELGRRYTVGEGVRRNSRLAFQWCERAASGGSVAATLRLGKHYLEGRGVPRDVAAAIALLRQVWSSPRADDDARADAALDIGWALMQEGDAPADRGRAQRWYRKAARLGETSAFYNLGSMAGEDEDYETSEHFFRLGAAAGHEGCVYELARLHIDGHAEARDIEHGRSLLRSIAGHHPSARRLLESGKLQRLRGRQRGSERGKPLSLPDTRFAGVWVLLDSDPWLEISVGARTAVACLDQEEPLEVSDVRWQGPELCFQTFCRSTDWALDNRLLWIDDGALLLVSTGAAVRSTVALRVDGEEPDPRGSPLHGLSFG